MEPTKGQLLDILQQLMLDYPGKQIILIVADHEFGGKVIYTSTMSKAGTALTLTDVIADISDGAVIVSTPEQEIARFSDGEISMSTPDLEAKNGKR